MFRNILFAVSIFVASVSSAGEVTEFCLDGQFDLGLRLQGMAPEQSEVCPTRWCVVTESDTDRVRYSATGKSNPDMDGSWLVAFLPPDIVRIVNSDAPPDVQFNGTDNADEARRVRRIDPKLLLREASKENADLDGIKLVRDGEQVRSASMFTELPLLGRVPVEWLWNWRDPQHPELNLKVDSKTLFRGVGSWRDLSSDEVSALWLPSQGVEPIAVSGDRWPARVNMHMIKLAEGVHLVRGVRTGFQHMVVETGDGLVVADAPAGWVEFYQLPPQDLVPGLGVSGLSEKFVDFLHVNFPGEKIRAVALTHHHDDHAGGARAFAAEGAEVFAPVGVSEYLSNAFHRASMPADRLGERTFSVTAVDQPTIIGKTNRVKLINLGGGPHVADMLGVLAIDKNLFFVSDVHVPRNEDDEPRQGRAVTECWFAKWAIENLPLDVQVVNSHSEIVTPVARLAKYLASDSCLKI